MRRSRLFTNGPLFVLLTVAASYSFADSCNVEGVKSVSTLEKKLSACGLPKDIRLRVVGEVVRSQLHDEPDQKYWKLEPLEQAERRINKSQKLISELEAVYGLGVTDQYAFEYLFYPLQSRLPNVSSEGQVLLNYALQRNAAQIQNLQLGEPVSALEMTSTMAKLEQEMMAEMVDYLMPSELDEYVIRMSSTAENLLRIGLDLSREDFEVLVVFISEDEVLRQLVTRQSFQPDSRIYNPDLALLLGKTHYNQFLRKVDPVFAMLSNQKGMAGVNVEIGYNELVTIQTNIASAKQGNKTAKLRKLREELQASINSNFGIYGQVVANLLDGSA